MARRPFGPTPRVQLPPSAARAARRSGYVPPPPQYRPRYRGAVPILCGPNQKAIWNGYRWVCATLPADVPPPPGFGQRIALPGARYPLRYIPPGPTEFEVDPFTGQLVVPPLDMTPPEPERFVPDEEGLIPLLPPELLPTPDVFPQPEALVPEMVPAPQPCPPPCDYDPYELAAHILCGCRPYCP